MSTGVVDENVNAAELFDRGGDGGIDLVFVRDVARHRDRLSTNGHQFSSGPLRALGIDLGDHNAGPLRGQRLGECPPEPDRSTGDESGLFRKALCAQRGSRHIGQIVGPPSGSTISPVTVNPKRS